MKLNFEIPKSTFFVFNCLSDMQKYAQVHPVIDKISSLGSGRYTVYETLKFAFIPISFTYPVHIEPDVTTMSVHMRATVMHLVKINMYFVLNQHKGICKVEETIEFDSILPISFLMKKIFKKQHTQLFLNISNSVEGAIS